MKKIALGIMLLSFNLALPSAHAADKCDQNRKDIGTKIGVTLALGNGNKVLKTFDVTSCKNNVFTAFDETKTTVMKYEAGQGEKRNIRFFGNSDDKAQVHPVVSAVWNTKTQSVSFATPGPGQCGPGEHWDSSMGMCMPNATTNCPAGYHWDPSADQCMPGAPSNSVMTMFHYNQFIMLTDSSGPRGREAISAPNMWMLMVDKKTSAHNTVELSWMGTTDLWTVPQNGTPELLQTGEANAAGVPFIDAQHPHSTPIMGLTFSDILSYGANGEKKLTFFFAPRGEATAGPESFMHRPSAEGNPDAPLGHHLQDVFHISSTVVGVKADYGRWTVEASTFSGQEPSPSEVNLDMHQPDSYAGRINYRVNDFITAGASYAKVTALDRVNNPLQQTEDERATAAWVQTSNLIKNGKLSTTSLWGQNDNRSTNVQLNSFLEEAMYELGKNNFYGRVEVLQRTPDQLEIQVTDGKTGARWGKAFTLGYERQIEARGDLKVYAGAAVTTYSMPFRVVYGSNPVAAKVYLRIKFNSGMHVAHRLSYDD